MIKKREEIEKGGTVKRDKFENEIHSQISPFLQEISNIVFPRFPFPTEEKDQLRVLYHGELSD